MAPPNKKLKAHRPWREIAKEAQDHRDASLAQVKPGLPDSFNEWERELETHLSDLLNGAVTAAKFLHPEEVRITEMLPEGLLALLASGELSATAVATAFLRRAVIAQKLVSSENIPNYDLNANSTRRTASPNSFQSEPWRGQNFSMITSSGT